MQGTGSGYSVTDLYAAIPDKYEDAKVILKGSLKALAWGLTAAGIAAGIWAFGAGNITCQYGDNTWAWVGCKLGILIHRTGPMLASSAVAIFWSMACAALGAGAGFLFGVPRSGAKPGEATVKAGPTAPAKTNPEAPSNASTDATGKADTPSAPISSGTVAPGDPAALTSSPTANPASSPAATASPATDSAGVSTSGSASGGGSSTIVASSGGGSDGNSQKAVATVTTKVNTNLEEISDWLTKIIVGVSLVEANKIVPYLGKAATMIGNSLGPPSLGTDFRISFAYAVLLYFTTVGFLAGYLLTRTFLQKVFDDVGDKAK